jgi:pyruvate kinase
MIKRTKIVATISDMRCDVDFIRSLWEAGMNAVRINTAHAGMEGATRIVENVRSVSDQIAVMIDTKGPEIRVTAMAPEVAKGIVVKEGDVIKVCGTGEGTPSTAGVVWMNDATLYDDVPVGAVILVDDGELAMEVVAKEDGERALVCRVKNAGVIKSHKSVNIPGVAIELPTLTQRDREYIEWAVANGVDFIAHSFVRSADDVRQVQKILDDHGSDIKIIAKIENREGVNNLDEILEVTYGVMVARGDLGVEIPSEQIPRVQRMIVRKCIESKTPVIIATQMLHSMITNPRPTRAEVSDIAGAIYQRVDAIMLSGETASGQYPREAVATMARIAVECEHDTANMSPDSDMNMVGINNEITAQLARSAVRATLNLPIKAIVIDTMSGRTGRYLSAFRSGRPVYAVCYRRSVMRQLALSYGIHAIYIEPHEGKENFLLRILYYLERRRWVLKEHLIVVVGGSFGDEQGASFMEIGTVLNLENKARH